MASYGTTSYPPPPTNRSRTASAGSRYVPEAYQTPPVQQAPMQASQGYPFPYGAPPGPSPNSQPPPMVPVPPSDAYSPMVGQHIPPHNTLHPSAAAHHPPYPIDDGYSQPLPTRPNDETKRRHSASSAYSRRSEDSRMSRDSHRSHHSHKSHHSRRSSSEEREKRHRRHEKERRERGEDSDKLARTDTHRPTLGDSMFAVYDTIKAALGPRDKY